MPTPPAVAAAMNAMRTTSGSMRRWRAIPEQTPASTAREGSRRSGSRDDVAVGGGAAPAAPAGVVVEDLDPADADVAGGRNAHVARHDELRLAHAEAELDVVVA